MNGAHQYLDFISEIPGVIHEKENTAQSSPCCLLTLSQMCPQHHSKMEEQKAMFGLWGRRNYMEIKEESGQAPLQIKSHGFHILGSPLFQWG